MKELNEYRKYTDRQETERVFHTLEGILRGINIDHDINQMEIMQLKQWCADYYDKVSRPPYDEVISLIFSITDDNIITQEEYEDLLWLCNNITMPNKYYDFISADLQRLHGVLHGIMADGVITKQELEGLQDWLDAHSYMAGVYPYDEIDALLFDVLEDGVVTEAEQNLLKVYFSQFVEIRDTAIDPHELEELRKTIVVPSICTMNPNITFKDHLFCFTGISQKGNRQSIINKIESLGGVYNNNIIKKTNYLVIGDKNNPCWVFSCYGRKIEKALENRRTGLGIQIVKEVDFWDETYK